VAPVRRRLARIALWLGAVALLLGLLELLGVPAFEWIGDLLDKVAEVPPWAIVAGIGLESAQTSFAALAWYGILRAALPSAVMPYRLGRALRLDLSQDRHRLLDRPAADHLRLGRGLRDHPRLLGLRLVRR